MQRSPVEEKPGPKVSSPSSQSLPLLLASSPKSCWSPSSGTQSPGRSPRSNQETPLPPISDPEPKSFNPQSLSPGSSCPALPPPPWGRTPRPLYLTPVFLPLCVQDTERPGGQNAVIEAVAEPWRQDGDGSSHRD